MVENQENQQGQLTLPKRHLQKKPFTRVVKRDGKIVKFDPEKIVVATQKAGEATGEYGRNIAEKLAKKVIDYLHKQFDANHLPDVEKIQNVGEVS